MNTKQIMKSALLIFLTILLLPFIVCAAGPSISSAPSTLTNGQSITISGSVFGTKSPAKPYLWADFNEGSANPSSLGLQTSWSALENMAYNSSEGVGGTGCLKATDSSGSWTALLNASGFNWNDYSQKIYVFRKTKTNFDITQSAFNSALSYPNWKVWRMWAANNTLPDIYIEVGQGTIYTEGIMSSADWMLGTFIGTTNSYNTEEIIFKNNTTSSSTDGIIQLYENGVKAADFSNIQTKNGSAAMTMLYPVHGVEANASFQSSYRYWADDVYVDTTWARVMICAGSGWSSRGHCEIQIPSAWSDASITISVNQGSFANGSTAWLYVIDASGTASAGTQITFTGTSGGTVRPNPPGLSN